MTKKVVYPERPRTLSGYSDEWMLAYFDDKANNVSVRKLKKFSEDIKGLKSNEKKKIFFDTFLEKKTTLEKGIEDRLNAQKKERKGKRKKSESKTDGE